EGPDLLNGEGRLAHRRILVRLIETITNPRNTASAQGVELQRCRGTVAISGEGRGGRQLVWQWMVRAKRQRGQGMVEYALILVLVSIVVIVILLTMGNQIQNVFSNVVAALG